MNSKRSDPTHDVPQNAPAKPLELGLLIGVRVVLCLIIFGAGVGIMFALTRMRKPPPEAIVKERPLKVQVKQAMPEDVSVVITGYGNVRSLNVVSLSSEVGGKVVYLHPRLESGEIVEQGAILFTIDPTNYLAAKQEAEAAVGQLEVELKHLQIQLETDTRRLETLKRNRDLARAAFQRLKRLYQNGQIASRTGMESAEQAYNAAVDILDQAQLAVALYPVQIQQTRHRLKAAKAALDLASANLERCQVKSPFTGRIQQVSVEQGQYLAPGVPALTLADDSILEIQVPMDSEDARKWLRFQKSPSNELAWFAPLEPVICRVSWTEDPESHWKGQLHRVVKYTPDTRTVVVAIRVTAANATSEDGNGLPLVDGMFCQVEIPGKTLRDVIRVPRWAVTFDGKVHLSVDHRLKSVPVTVARTEGEDTFISSGLTPGDRVITTRLVDPMENTLLETKSMDQRKNSQPGSPGESS